MTNGCTSPIMTGPTELEGQTILDSSGEMIGEVEEIYRDLHTGNWDWALIRTGGQFGDRRHFVPLAGAHAQGVAVRVRVTKDKIRDAPGLEAEQRLSALAEQRLLAHYGVSDVRDDLDACEESAQRALTATSEQPPATRAERWPSPRADTQIPRPTQTPI